MKRNIVIAAVAAAVVIGGGAATALATGGEDGSAAHRAEVRAADARVSADRAPEDRGGGSARVDAAEAIAAALRHTPGTAVSAELDDADDAGGRLVWEVDVLTGGGEWRQVLVDPADGRVLGSHREHEDDTAEVRSALKGTSVDAAGAARAAAGKGTVTSVELDEDGRVPAWEVETRASGHDDDHDWRVDLRTGEVTRDHSDDDGDDD
ncbi:PepSY domain-containing protein [Streptomyces tagetis]|uniref:PepSY domain-containing protein n=1 Tax=Streptomyces tagetis TaxID=2820809 RepID=A0A940XP16_9ACTN|nr:PepSY domain-containing protein [Streptomyces sp. RG38]MBQ0828134.1 PepSY domain-containing protein [Streptomyces sp. RG38]